MLLSVKCLCIFSRWFSKWGVAKHFLGGVAKCSPKSPTIYNHIFHPLSTICFSHFIVNTRRLRWGIRIMVVLVGESLAFYLFLCLFIYLPFGVFPQQGGHYSFTQLFWGQVLKTPWELQYIIIDKYKKCVFTIHLLQIFMLCHQQ